jgi:hypothetical protein
MARTLPAGGIGGKRNQREGVSGSFLKKRTKKLLHIGLRLPDGRVRAIQKFFASFFQKRSLGLCFLALAARARRLAR